MGKTLVFTDLHGCYDGLIEMMDRVVSPNIKYKYVFLGDYVDRGNKSKEVIDYLIELKRISSESVFLLGNHDDWFLSFLEGTMEKEVLNLWLYQGGHETLLSYVPDYLDTMSLNDVKDYINKNYSEHVNFLKELELYHEDDNFYYAHGGCRLFESDLSKNDKSDFIWPNRRMFYNHRTELDKPIILGHTIVNILHGKDKPFIEEDRICIDGGYVFGYCLISMEIENKNGEYKFEILKS